jgi:sugar lactone lactonase YvrE
MNDMKPLLAAALVVVFAVTTAAGAKTKPFPDVIALPNGIQPEGIEIGNGTTFYAGSRATGAVVRGDLRAGKVVPLVPAASGRAALGIEYDRGRLYVAGGTTGRAFVYDGKTGATVANVQLTTASPTFVNDVVVTRDAAWFTDSNNQQLYRIAIGGTGAIGSVTTVPLTGAISYGSGFNANGIDATANGKTLVIVQSNTGKLFTVTPGGVTKEIALGGGSVPNGDGILLEGRTLYVVQNQLNQIAKIRLSAGLTSGRVVGTIKDSDFDIPTTVDSFGNNLYAVNARFSTTPTPSTAYQVVKTRK